MSSWNATLYLQFSNERTQPSIDLISRIQVAEPKRIIDLGCGPGNSTAMLRQRWPEAETVGLDSSAAMIAAATEAYPDGRWVLSDAAQWKADAPFDIVFSNAALQWLPDHAQLYSHLFAQVASGGVFAVQIPSHYESPFHKVLREVAALPSWNHLLDGARNALTKHTPAFYYDVLRPLATRLDIWETEYIHVLDSPQGILNWYRATGLRPYLEALESDTQRQQFENLLLEGYSQFYPRQKDGRVLFPFRRLFLLAYQK